ncbi:MAG: riboflavin biosynthesis protein RibF [Clostridia bacterium]|nr:riboflavin biosynthesis protein RibF [Clostridia bacterium]
MLTHNLTDQQLHIPAIPRSVALGLFDGLHPGHRQVILAAVRQGEDCLSRAVYTFIPHTVNTKTILGRLCDDQEEQQLLQTMDVDELFKEDFAAVRHLTPAEFVEKVLVEQLHARQVTCGYNYRFGAGGAGDAALLTTLCAQHGIAVTVVPEVDCGGSPINSTTIRAAIAHGDMSLARRLLGRPYHLQAPVTQGQHLGRRLGLPTINQILPTHLVAPRFGVYASCVQWDGHVYPAVTNIGVRPTVGTDAPLAETYILGFDGDLYGTEPTVYPLEYLRPEQKFESLEALQAQIRADVARAEALFAAPRQQEIRAIFFDFDDTLDNRDAAFRQGLSRFIRYYYPSLTEEEVASRSEEMFLYQRGGYGQIIYYRDLLQHFYDLYPPEVPYDPAKAMRRLVGGFAAAGQPHPDVYDTLTTLRQRGYRLGVITNGTARTQACKLDYSGLRPYLDLVVLAGEEGIQKPDPRVFQIAAARLGVPCACCVFVGDNPENDLMGAKNAGFIPLRKHPDLDDDHPFHQMEIPADIPVIKNIGDILLWLDNPAT